ncbi:sensor histidine kinase [Urbifossiella limnaea]|uniref:histidine kinase n=1 Tax=Urbifossiella limnaea TaxID=2528023 RepID=A0A517XTI7_9BACT|nr:HAMP domain-containing sensor histidine kinase [Urbifossiella limnaea]QDU20808.1 Alkaline phosphatase synthesis sensor protein PhoR [Urbifossiella limnaea]
MRSIRRSLLGYFLLLLAVALGLIAAFVDRYAVGAVRAREESESNRITAAFDARKLEAQAKFDAELVQEARSLAGELNRTFFKAWGRFRPPDQPRPGGKGPPEPKSPPELKGIEPRPSFPGKAPDEDGREYLRRVTALMLQPPAAGNWLPTAEAASATHRAWSPGWISFASPRTATRVQIPEMLHRPFVEGGDHTGYYQFHVVADYPGRPWQAIGTVRPARLHHDLPLDLARVEDSERELLPADEVRVEGQGVFRRAVVWTAVTPQGSRPLLIPVWHENQSYSSGAGARATSFFYPPIGPSPRAFRPDFWLRVFVHAARPQAELDSRFVAAAAERDQEIVRVHSESREELTKLRTRLAAIAVGSFLALVIGGWFIVARGLAPVRTLSDAVSRVSEKDFALPVSSAALSVELAPIHARLTQTLDQLRAAFAREKDAVADISHELRTPIASLLATIDVTLRKSRTPEQYRATLEDCRGIAKQLGQLVERIMTLASLDAGTARGAVSRVDATELAGSCAVVIRPLAEAHGLSFTLSAVGPAELDTDPDRLREVLMNLLHNAVEYNRAGGRVELAVRADAGRVVFEVRDTGIGMTDEVRAKIFERFYRADASRTATGVHAGLGLAIVKEYVERLGGAIEVESTPGEGSVFRATFPAAAGQPESLAPPPDAARPEPRVRSRPTPAAS